MITAFRNYSRRRRASVFRSFIAAMKRPLNIVDLGGTVRFWVNWGVTAQDRLNITLINNHRLDPTNRDSGNPFPFIVNRDADATELGVADLREYDVIFSNSFLEHLEDRRAQARLAKTIMESQVPYFIQVPNKHSPIDPHFPSPLVPFFAMYPEWLRARLLTIGAFGSGGKAPSLARAHLRMKFYNPLGNTDVSGLFPNAVISFERPLIVIATSILATYAGMVS